MLNEYTLKHTLWNIKYTRTYGSYSKITTLLSVTDSEAKTPSTPYGRHPLHK